LATKTDLSIKKYRDSVNNSNDNLCKLFTLGFLGKVFSGDDRGVIAVQDIEQFSYMCQAPANNELHPSTRSPT